MARIPTVNDVEELAYIPTVREERRRRDIDERLMHLFPLFDKEDTGMCDVREVGTILRAMNLNPSEAMVTQVVESIEEAESTGYVKMTKLRGVVMEILMSHEYKNTILVRDDEDTIVKAFEMLDRDKKGYVDAEYLKEVMTTMGEKFNNEEILEMINAASDPETGHIYYEDYAALLATE